MRIWRRILAIGYLLVCIVVLGGFGFQNFGPYQAQVAQILSIFGVRVAVVICLAIMVVYSLCVILKLFFKRPDPTCIHPDGNQDVQITRGALEAVVRASAQDEDALVESIKIRIKGHDRARAIVRIEAIALTNHDVGGLAQRIQDRVTGACSDMLGSTGVTVQVRFLPSKTETFIREASGE